MGFYDFTDSRVLSKRIIIEPSAGVEDLMTDNNLIRILTQNGSIIIYNKVIDAMVKIYTLQGTLIKEINECEIHDIKSGLYIITVGNQSFKVAL